MGGVGSGAKPREYPPEIVELVCSMYQAGMTIREIRDAAPRGFRVETILYRYLPELRRAIKRNQSGAANHHWKSRPGYQAAHLRVAAASGAAGSHACVDCGQQAAEWSYVHDCPDELSDGRKGSYCLHLDHYEPRCRRCHRRFDREWRESND